MANLDFSEIAKLNERYNKDPKSKIFVQLADAYRKNDMIDEALDVLNKGLQYHPQYSLAHLIQGKCYFAKRTFAQARESFEQVLSLDSHNIIAVRMLAQTCESLKDETGQISAYKSILAIDPLDTATKEKLELLERTQKQDTFYTLSMAQEYENQQNFSQALTIYEYLLSTDPTDLVLQQKVNELSEKVGKKEMKIEEEKIEGLQLETFFRPEDLMQKEETTTPEIPISPLSGEPKPAETQEVPIEQNQEKQDFPPPPPPEQISAQAVTEEKHPDDEILSLEDFLVEEPTDKSEGIQEEPTVQSEKKTAENARVHETEKFAQLFTEAEKAQIEGKVKIEQSQEEEKPSAVTPIEKEPPKVEKVEEPKAEKQPETPKLEGEKKPKEEDFQSFKEWLSGLLK